MGLGVRANIHVLSRMTQIRESGRRIEDDCRASCQRGGQPIPLWASQLRDPVGLGFRVPQGRIGHIEKVGILTRRRNIDRYRDFASSFVDLSFDEKHQLNARSLVSMQFDRRSIAHHIRVDLDRPQHLNPDRDIISDSWRCSEIHPIVARRSVPPPTAGQASRYVLERS
jgi:hypothetical protein